MDEPYSSRAYVLGEYIAKNGATVRDAARHFGISKSTVHKDVTEKLRIENRALFERVRIVLDKNKAERHVRGGEATKQKYIRESALSLKQKSTD
jgi:putative DeoR family transcriptional regulator (stage III sporulation protein D)